MTFRWLETYMEIYEKLNDFSNNLNNTLLKSLFLGLNNDPKPWPLSKASTELSFHNAKHAQLNSCNFLHYKYICQIFVRTREITVFISVYYELYYGI